MRKDVIVLYIFYIILEWCFRSVYFWISQICILCTEYEFW